MTPRRHPRLPRPRARRWPKKESWGGARSAPLQRLHHNTIAAAAAAAGRSLPPQPCATAPSAAEVTGGAQVAGGGGVGGRAEPSPLPSVARRGAGDRPPPIPVGRPRCRTGRAAVRGRDGRHIGHLVGEAEGGGAGPEVVAAAAPSR